MRSYEACGMSGPQIGLPWQIFAIEYTKEHMKAIHEVVKKVHEVEIIPMTLFINPELKVIDHTPIILHEGCESIRGYSAAVPRAYEVEITALNASAEQFTWKGRGWSARIAQHEYDHLQVRFKEEKNLYVYNAMLLSIILRKKICRIKMYKVIFFLFFRENCT